MPRVLNDPACADDERDMIHLAVQALSEGKLVAFPTETVYGIAADARNESAVARLLAIKGRRPGQPLTLAVKSAEEAFQFCPDVSPVGQRLGRRCWPGPLTLVLKGSHPRSPLSRLPAGVRQAVAPAEFVGLRVPDHRFLLETLRLLPAPVTLTSANRSGQADAVSAEEVVEALGDDVDLVLSDGRSQIRPAVLGRARPGTDVGGSAAGSVERIRPAAIRQPDRVARLHREHVPQSDGPSDVPAARGGDAPMRRRGSVLSAA